MMRRTFFETPCALLDDFPHFLVPHTPTHRDPFSFTLLPRAQDAIRTNGDPTEIQVQPPDLVTDATTARHAAHG